MSTVQVGNGWFNTKTLRYTQYNPQTGQMQTSLVPIDPRNVDSFVQGLQSGQYKIQDYIRQTDSNFLGGRSNVNVSRQIGNVFERIKSQYPQLTKDQAMNYANQWVKDRMAAGWDANEIENLMKDVGRGENSLNEDFVNGVMGNIRNDEFNATPGDATGASMANAQSSIQDDLRAFAHQMMQTVGPDSPQAKRIAELAAQAGNKYATSSGMGPGGITSRGVAATAARAHTDLQTQRESIGLSALAAAGNQQLTVDAAKTALQQQQQQAGVLNASGIGGLIGSGLGLVGGIVGSAATYGAMAPAIPGFMQAGGAAGQGIGGIVGNQQGPIQYGGQQAPTSRFTGRNWGTS